MAHDYFLDYRKAHDDMEGDEELQVLLDQAEDYKMRAEFLREPYLQRIRKAEEGIHVITIDQQRTVILHGIEAKYSKPRKSTSWKNVAMSFTPSNELIEEHSKVGSATVKITVHELLDLED